MAKFCVYCGKPVREDDKFCISCGKPLISSLPRVEKKEKEKVTKKPEMEEKKTKEQERKEEEMAEEEVEEKKEKQEDDLKEEEIKPLPDEVKQQIEYYLELNDIRLKKLSLDEKLKDLETNLKSDRYETDFEFGEKINVQLKAVKTVMEELKEEEKKVKEKLTDKFVIEKLEYDIETKRSHLKNLMREHKLKKIKDKEVVKKLKAKYKNQLENFIEEKAELIAGIQLWIDELIEEKTELNTERKFNKARFSAKEITETDFKDKDEEFEIKIKKLDNKIQTLEDLIK
ncbi:MAG: zinc-ribbon domain-containing protein [Promethearchaeota archaeon]|nr:MAG: zinc-ribbon domain-containing protein [Candidatus Lokiarchaeota archaeon]